MKRSVAVMCVAGFALLSLSATARAQSADLVLCDRIAADPDKPADVRGVITIAKSDIATAIKFCKTASAGSRRALYQLGRAYAANKPMAEALATWRKAAARQRGSQGRAQTLRLSFWTQGQARPGDDQSVLLAASPRLRGIQ